MGGASLWPCTVQWKDRCKGDLQTTQCSELRPGVVGSDDAKRGRLRSVSFTLSARGVKVCCVIQEGMR